MTKNEKEEMYAAIERHGHNLLALFPNATIKDPIALCKALRRLEVKAHKAAENWCNGVDCGADGDAQYNIGNGCAKRAGVILASFGTPFMIKFTGDARGYSLKVVYIGKPQGTRCDSIPHGIAIYKDWGGYGIIAPDFTSSK